MNLVQSRYFLRFHYYWLGNSNSFLLKVNFVNSTSHGTVHIVLNKDNYFIGFTVTLVAEQKSSFVKGVIPYFTAEPALYVRFTIIMPIHIHARAIMIITENIDFGILNGRIILIKYASMYFKG